MHERRLISNVTVFVNVECVQGDRCAFVVCGFEVLLLHWYHILGLLYNRLLHFDPPGYLNPFHFRLCFIFGQFLHKFNITFNGSVTNQSYFKKETFQAAT